MNPLPRTLDGLRNFVHATSMDAHQLTQPVSPHTPPPRFSGAALSDFAESSHRSSHALTLTVKAGCRPVHGVEEALLQLWAISVLERIDPARLAAVLNSTRTRTATALLHQLHDLFYCENHREVLLHGLIFNTAIPTTHVLEGHNFTFGGGVIGIPWELISQGVIPRWLTVLLEDLMAGPAAYEGADCHAGSLTIDIVGAPTSSPFATPKAISWMQQLAPVVDLLQLINVKTTDPHLVAALLASIPAEMETFASYPHATPLSIAAVQTASLADAQSCPVIRGRLTAVAEFVAHHDRVLLEASWPY